MKRAMLLLSLAFLITTGCKKHEPVQTIALVDISGSIYSEEVDRAFSEMQSLARSLQLGDELVIMPITGNARNDTPGHILRLHAPTMRSPFDSDLIHFRKRADEEILKMKCWAKRNPARHTDIFGTLSLAQEIRQSAAHLLILSDFLEDDGLINFTFDPALATVSSARRSACRIRNLFPSQLSFADVTAIRLRSRDAARIDRTRTEAIDEFWRALFFADSGLRFRE